MRDRHSPNIWMHSRPCSPLELSRNLPSVSGWCWRQRLEHRQAGPHQPVLATPTARTPKLARLEAALFVAENAQSPKKLAQVAALEDAREALELIEQLNTIYQQSHSAFRIERVATGFRLLARQELATWLDRVHQRQALTRLSPPLLETVTIIAYRQPCTRADVESIRGVQSAEIIKNLMERNLVRVVGEDDSLGRPYLYGTTRQFLETFGLISLADLPHADRLRRQNASAPESTEEADGSRQAA